MTEIRFTREDVTGVGDPAAAGTDAEGAGAPPPPPHPSDAGPGTTAGAVGESPAAADRRAGEEGGGNPVVPILGAFVGAFVAAKVLGRLTGGDE